MRRKPDYYRSPPTTRSAIQHRKTRTEARRYRDALVATLQKERSLFKHFLEFVQQTTDSLIRVEVERIDEQICIVLGDVARLFHVERGYIFMLVPECASIELTHEWCAAGVLPHRGVLDTIRIADFEDFLASMRRGEVANVQTNTIPRTPATRAMTDVLDLLQIKSFVNIPLFISEELIGWIGFDAVAQTNVWTEEVIEAFRLTGKLIANALHRKQSEADLHRSEQQFHALFNHMVEGVALHKVIYDQSGKPVNYMILDVNPQYERILNLRREQVRYQLATSVYGTATAPYLAEFTGVGISGQPYQFETYFAPMDKYFSISVSPLGPGQFATIFFDITARKQAEAAHERLQARLVEAQKLEAIGQLAGGVAHDFNNILTVINCNTDLALETLPAHHPAYEDLQEIRQSARRATHLVRQLLTFARRQGGLPEIVDINQLVVNIIPMLRRLIGEQIELAITPGPVLSQVKIDPHQFEQVLINLAVNARDAMPGGGRLSITTASLELNEAAVESFPEAVPGTYVQVAVGDTGVGITEAVKARIFEPYYTTKEVGQGTGLGLAICLSIVKQHQGFIWVNSTPGQGSCFQVYLPSTSESIAPSSEGNASANPDWGFQEIAT